MLSPILVVPTLQGHKMVQVGPGDPGQIHPCPVALAPLYISLDPSLAPLYVSLLAHTHTASTIHHPPPTTHQLPNSPNTRPLDCLDTFDTTSQPQPDSCFGSINVLVDTPPPASTKQTL